MAEQTIKPTVLFDLGKYESNIYGLVFPTNFPPPGWEKEPKVLRNKKKNIEPVLIEEQ